MSKGNVFSPRQNRFKVDWTRVRPSHSTWLVLSCRPWLNQSLCVKGLVILDGPNKLDARGVPGLGLVITLVSLCTCNAVASASEQVLPANVCVTSSSDSGTGQGCIDTLVLGISYGLLGVW